MANAGPALRGLRGTVAGRAAVVGMGRSDLHVGWIIRPGREFDNKIVITIYFLLTAKKCADKIVITI
jgi:hypothetical protein